MKKYQRLKDLREDADLSQAQVAEILGTSGNYYGSYENGQREIPFSRIIKLAEYYGVSIDYIAGLTNDKGGLHGTSGELSGYFELNDEYKKHILDEIDIMLEKQCRSKENRLKYTFPKAQ